MASKNKSARKPVNKNYLWQWHFGGQKFEAFSDADNKKLNRGVQNGDVEIQLQITFGNRVQDYTVNVSTMVQTNDDTGYERCVRCGIQDYDDKTVYWFWMVDDIDGQLCGLPPSVCAQLVVANMSGLTKLIVGSKSGGQDWVFQLDNMQEVGRAAGSGARLHRIKVEGVSVPDDSPPVAAPALRRSARSTRSTAAAASASEVPQTISSGTSRGRKRKATAPTTTAVNGSDEPPSSGKKKKASKMAESSNAAAVSSKKPAAKPSATSQLLPAKTDSGSIKTKIEAKKEEKEKKENDKGTSGKAVVKVDKECPLASTGGQVYTEGGDIYDVTLNQTNIGTNNNKYYLIQLLTAPVPHGTTPRTYYTWFRWGRVGYQGQTNLTCHNSSLDKAKTAFLKKFSDKTKNDFSDRHKFIKYAGKYDLVWTDYSAADEDGDDEKQQEDGGVDAVDSKSEVSDDGKVKSKPEPVCELDQRVQDLMTLIYNKSLFESCVREMSYDVKKAPLGKLTPAQITLGYSALNQIAQLISQRDLGRNLQDACSTFYTRIPHYFGMRMPPLIRTDADVKKKMELLDALSNIEIAVHNLSGDGSAGPDKHPISRNYEMLHCDITPLERDTSEYKLIEQYLSQTHAPTHNTYTLSVEQAFTLCKESVGGPGGFRDEGNRHLLWHGSRLTNYAGILSTGLRVAPPEAPVTGYMFGKGVYFADRSSKSANYCFTTPSKNTGLLLLCEVSLGTCNELAQAKYDADKLPTGKHSTLGKGMMVPQSYSTLPGDAGCQVPVGQTVRRGAAASDGKTEWLALQYNEYCVYDPAQIKLRYLVKCRFNYK